MERLHDACGVVGIYAREHEEKSIDVRRYLTLALSALQHRGQESAGMAVYDSEGRIFHRVGMGKVRDVFSDTGTGLPVTHCGIGHVRYSTTGSSCVENAGPFVVGAQPNSYEALLENRLSNDARFTSQAFGNDASASSKEVWGTSAEHSSERKDPSSFAQETRKECIAVAHNGNLVNGPALREELPQELLNSTTDSEVIAWLLLHADGPSLRERMIALFPLLHGAYSLV